MKIDQNSKAYKEGYSYGSTRAICKLTHSPYPEDSKESKAYFRGMDHAIEDRLS